MADINDIIEAAAGAPLSAEQDGRKAVARSLAELIEAANYLAGVTAAAGGASGWQMLRGCKMVPPGGGPQPSSGRLSNRRGYCDC